MKSRDSEICFKQNADEGEYLKRVFPAVTQVLQRALCERRAHNEDCLQLFTYDKCLLQIHILKNKSAPSPLRFAVIALYVQHTKDGD